MRIKIKGEITAERLAEALHAAAEKYEHQSPRALMANTCQPGARAKSSTG